MVTPAGEWYTQQYPSCPTTRSADSRRKLEVSRPWLTVPVATVRLWEAYPEFQRCLPCCQRNGACIDNDPAVAACVREDAFDVEDVAEAIDRWGLGGPA